MFCENCVAGINLILSTIEVVVFFDHQYFWKESIDALDFLHMDKHEFEFNFFFSIWVFFHDHSRITGLQGKGEGISLTPYYHFHPLYGHLDISRAITAESSSLHIACSRTRTGNVWFPSASR